MTQPSVRRPPDNQLHQGLFNHRVRAVGGVIGSSAGLLAVGAVLVYLAEWDSPTRWFFLGSLLLGLAGVGLLRARYWRTTAEVKRLSILGKP